MSENAKNIELKLDDKTLTNLAGNRFGSETYRKQSREKIDDKMINYIILPDQIEDIASSFIQGMYSELSEECGRERALEVMVLKSDNDELAEKINRSLRVYSY